MYLKIKDNNQTKQYTLTSSFQKPYMVVKHESTSSVLPLTTNTTSGMHLKVKANNTTYRPMEFTSASGSGTYYTSQVNSDGLSSVTALTYDEVTYVEPLYSYSLIRYDPAYGNVFQYNTASCGLRPTDNSSRRFSMSAIYCTRVAQGKRDNTRSGFSVWGYDYMTVTKWTTGPRTYVGSSQYTLGRSNAATPWASGGVYAWQVTGYNPVYDWVITNYSSHYATYTSAYSGVSSSSSSYETWQ